MIEGNNTNTYIHASPSLLMKYGRKPQPLPIRPMGIIAYTFAFLGTTFVKIAVYTRVGQRYYQSNESSITFVLHNFINLLTFVI